MTYKEFLVNTGESRLIKTACHEINDNGRIARAFGLNAQGNNMNKTTLAIMSIMAATLAFMPTASAMGTSNSQMADNQIDCKGGIGGPLVTWAFQTVCYEVSGACDIFDPCPLQAMRKD